MPYAVADVELTDGLPEIALGQGQNGFALLVRRRGRPIAFLLREHAPGAPVDLAGLLAEETGLLLLREALAEELAGGTPVPATGHVAAAAPGAELDPGWERALAEALAEQPDAAVVAGPAVPRALTDPQAVAAERALPDRFDKLRIAPRGAAQAPELKVLRVLAAAGAVAVRPDVGPPCRPPDAIAGALRAGLPVAYEPGLLARTPGGGDARAAARERGAATVALLAALGQGRPALRPHTRRRTARWFAREARRAVLLADARPLARAELTGALAPRSR
jgi:hypothetical protein